MTGLESLGRVLLVAGGALCLLGILFVLGDRVPLLGHLPGDIRFERGNLRVFIPLGSSLLVSLLLTLVVNIVQRLIRR